MKVIVVGAGEVGFHITDRLSSEGHDVTIVERDPDKIRPLQNRLNALIVEGSGGSSEVLEKASISTMDLFIAVTDMDEVNLVACLLAHQHGVPRTIARIKSLEYTNAEWMRNAAKLGIDMIINPQSVVAEEIVHTVEYTAATEVAEFAHGRVVFIGYPINADSPLAGVSLMTLGDIRGLYKMVITAITRQGETIIPRGDDEIQPGDTVYFCTDRKDLGSINDLFGFEEKEARNIFILGGGKVGFEVARMMGNLNYGVKIVERDKKRCEELARILENVTVLNTAGTDIETLKNEGIERGDVLIAVTNDDKANILCSLLAKRYGVQRVIALVNQREYVTLAPSLGIDVCISPRLATASAIIKFMRQAEILNVAVVEQTDSEVLELLLHEGSPILHKPLKELEIPKGSIIGAIVRGEEAIVPSGDDHLEAGDHVVVFTLPRATPEVEKFFA
jgi:trk system potassium uptake protein TrkA